MKTKEFEIEVDEGYIRAYVVENTIDNLDNLFKETDIENPLLILNKMAIGEFIYFEEIFIYQEFRRQGFATQMVQDFLNRVEDEDIPVVLIAGGDYTPKDMDIVKFYEDFGFDILVDNGEQIIMIR